MLAVYLRLSKEDDDSNSINNQRRESLEYINKNNIKNFQEYNEGEGLSGTKDETEREQLNQLMKDIEDGKISSVWMRKQDRLARSGLMVLRFAQTIVNNKVKLHFGDKGDVDLTDPIEMFHLTIMAGVDALKPAQQSKGTIKALHDNFNEGKVWGVIPYGYRSDENMMPYVDKKETSIVNRIFNEYLEGKSAYKIANGLNEDNVPTKKSKTEGTTKHTNKYTKEVTEKSNDSIIWVEKTITDMLKNIWYNGTRTYAKKTDAKKTGAVPRIVDEILFNKVQQAIQARKGKRKSKPKYNYLLKGLIRCDKCGRNYYGRVNANDNAYMCSSKRSKLTNCGNAAINITRLESFIIKHLFKSKDLLKMMESVTDDNGALTKLETQISELETQQSKKEYSVNKYAKLLGEELEDDDVIINQYQNAKKQVSDIKTKLIQLKVEQADLKNSEALNNYKKELANVAKSSDFNTLEIAVNNLIENIRILSSKDVNGEVLYKIVIEYKGLSEVSIFYTKQPYDKFIYYYHRKPATEKQKLEQLTETIEAIEFAYKTKIKKEDYYKFVTDEDEYEEAFYNLDNIFLAGDDIVRFNKKIK